MDRKKCGEKFPGELVRITTPRPDYAFLPHPLPAGWEFDPVLWPLLVEAKEALGTLNGIGQTLTDAQLLLRPLQSREAITSSSIEGTVVTPQELLLFEIEPESPVSASEKRADWQEVHNYRKALEAGCEMLEGTGFSEYLIRSMHAILMQGVRGVDKSPGEYRRGQVQIGSTGRFISAPPEHVAALMNDLMSFTTSESDLDPLIKAFMIHYQFETIHPFSDGNGRVGRALLALMIYRWSRHAHPWLYLSAFFEKYRDEYMSNLFSISSHGEWTKWMDFCLHGTIAQANDAILRCRLFRELKEKYHQQIRQPTSRTHRLVESLFRLPYVTAPLIAAQFDVAYKTARRELENLVAIGILTEAADSHPRYYFASEIIRIAYSSDAGETPSAE